MRRGLPLALVVLIAALGVFAFAGCGGGDDGDAAAPAATEGATTETSGAETGEGEAVAGDAMAGAQVFSEAGCGSCHTLAAAGSSGTTGPNLDELQPSFDQVVEQVTNGGGGMPSFKDQLSEQQISDVAAYVVESTKG